MKKLSTKLHYNCPKILAPYVDCITPNDVERSATVGMLDDLLTMLTSLKRANMDRMLDIGVGYGGLTRLIADYLGIQEVHGIDIDNEVFKEAQSKDITTHLIDVQQEPLPFSDNYFDLVCSFGVLEHLVFWDQTISEISRIMRPNGYILISIPNLASWNNRLLLLLGYQLRDVEVSEKIITGTYKWYSQKPLTHLHSLTLKGMEDLLEIYGFKKTNASRGRPYPNRLNPFVRLIDNLFSLRTSLARRFFYLGRKPHKTLTSRN